MAPKSWADDARFSFLMSYLPLYEVYHSTTKRYQPFWDVLFPAYIQKWPILPPGTNSEDLNAEQFKEYSVELAKLYKRLQEWYRWRCSNRSRGTTTTITTKEMKDIYAPGTHSAKEYEIFVKQYPNEFQPKYEAECALQGVSGRARLPVWHKIAGEMWEKATPEQKAAVQAQVLASKEVEEEPAPSTPSEYQKHWDKLPAILSKTVTPAVRKAGVLGFVTVVGPVPSAGGQILATILQFGDKPETPLFSSTWVDHDAILVEQLAKFAGRYEFPPNICSERSLQHTLKPEEIASSSGSNTVGDDATSTAASSSGQGVMRDVALSGGSTGDAATGGPESLDGSASSTVDLPAGSIPSVTSVTSETPPASNTNGQPPLNATSVHDSQSQPTATSLEQATAGFVDFNSCSFNISEPWDFGKWADPDILERITELNAPEDHLEPYTTHTPVANGSTFTPATAHTPLINTTGAALPSFQLNGTPASEMAASSNVSVPNTPVVALHDPMVPQPVPAAVPATPSPPLTTFTAFQGPPTQPQEPVLPNHTMMPSNVSPLTLSTTADHLPAPTDQALRTTSDTFLPPRFDFLSTPNMANIHTFSSFHNRDQHRHPQTDENTPPAPPPDTHDQHHATSDDAPIQDQNGIRRSNRPPVPSTRVNKLNEIGTNIVPPKHSTENNDGQEPIWFQPSREYLTKIDLGPSWSGLVEKWAEYESAKGWKSGKGLPAKFRPEEWQQWASKGRHGPHNYQVIPTVLDPNELGIAILKWVDSFTPMDFGRTGPHGLFSLLSLTYWWGIGARTPSSWNDDSRPRWCSLVQDLIRRIDELLNTGHMAAKRTREDDIKNETHKDKRPRTDSITASA